MARRLYTLLFYLLLPLILLRLAYRGFKAPAYRARIAERFGFFTPPDLSDCIWLHSVSVGETIAAAPLVKRLQQQYPNTPLVVTTMTPTGSAQVRSLFGNSVFHVYAPYDLPGAVKRFLQRIQPRLLIIMETELWPNTVHYCRQQKVPVLLANARLSERSARGYQRFAALTQPMLKQLSCVVAQAEADKARFVSLGLPESAVQVSGSIKFDVAISAALQQRASELKAQWNNAGARQVLLAASTHEGEDAILLTAFQGLLSRFPNLLLVLVPRHPERFDQVASLAEQRGLITQRYSQQTVPDQSAQVFIGDAVGELMLWYGCADLVFVGGSLVNRGGHNMLEPAAWGLPVLIGPSVFNFQSIAELLLAQQALVQLNDSSALSGQLTEQITVLLTDQQQRQALSDNARQVVEDNRGALDKLLEVIARYER